MQIDKPIGYVNEVVYLGVSKPAKILGIGTMIKQVRPQLEGDVNNKLTRWNNAEIKELSSWSFEKMFDEIFLKIS